jgi:GT2 family glycosyltransferase
VGGQRNSIAVVIPTYNEAENIEPLVGQLLALPLPLRVIVMDDNSPDGTGDILDKLAAADAMLRLRARDCTAGFRCYRREALERVALDEIFSEGYSFLIEMLYRTQRLGYRVGEVPIIFENRRRGASKVSKREIYRALYTVFRLRFGRLPWGRGAARRSAGG